MSNIFCPSIMCMKLDNLAQSIKELDESGIDRYHLDVMDGVFVPNFALGIQDIEAVCRLSDKKSEVHLMTVNPDRHIRKFVDAGVDIIYIHPDSGYHPSTAIHYIIESGAAPGIVLSPGTSVDSVKDLLGIVNHVLVMTVNPGQAGQPFLPYVDDKIKQLAELKKERGFELGLDGANTAKRIKQYASMGIDSFVLGTAALFHKKEPYKETVSNLRRIADGKIPSVQKKSIKYFVTDVDGTLTDGKIYMSGHGELMKAFDIKDGFALHELLPENGITPVIITGRKSEMVENRARELGVKHVFQAVSNKLELLVNFSQENGVSLEELAYFGDDANDLECIKACGIGGCPADAAGLVKESAKYVSKNNSGAGAVRDFAEYLIRNR